MYPLISNPDDPIASTFIKVIEGLVQVRQSGSLRSNYQPINQEPQE